MHAMATEAELRADLAALLRIAAKLDWPEAVANHASVAIDAGGRHFLMNPRWRHFGSLCASDMQRLDAAAKPQDLPPELDPTAWAIHGTMHAQLPQARCILHVHPPYATTLACLADPGIKPVDQTSARFHRRVAIDRGYAGMADNAAEGLRLTRTLGGMRVLMMGNHGVLVVAKTVPVAFERLYFLERAAQAQVLALSTGRPLQIIPEPMIKMTVAQFAAGGTVGGRDRAELHFDALKRVLDRSDSDYAS